jgi:hypothetical protein
LPRLSVTKGYKLRGKIQTMAKAKAKSSKGSAKARRESSAPKRLPDDFISVARRLGADEDKATFEAKLAKIAKAKSRSS